MWWSPLCFYCRILVLLAGGRKDSELRITFLLRVWDDGGTTPVGTGELIRRCGTGSRIGNGEGYERAPRKERLEKYIGQILGGLDTEGSKDWVGCGRGVSNEVQMVLTQPSLFF